MDVVETHCKLLNYESGFPFAELAAFADQILLKSKLEQFLHDVNVVRTLKDIDEFDNIIMLNQLQSGRLPQSLRPLVRVRAIPDPDALDRHLPPRHLVLRFLHLCEGALAQSCAKPVEVVDVSAEPVPKPRAQQLLSFLRPILTDARLVPIDDQVAIVLLD